KKAVVPRFVITITPHDLGGIVDTISAREQVRARRSECGIIPAAQQEAKGLAANIVLSHNLARVVDTIRMGSRISARHVNRGVATATTEKAALVVRSDDLP